jgi:Spy/CpxP family protein refolding chaperone
MKTTTILASASFLLTAVIALVAGRADAANGLSTWEGTGTAYNAQGGPLGAYSLSVTRKQDGPNVRIDGKATLSGRRMRRTPRPAFSFVRATDRDAGAVL